MIRNLDNLIELEVAINGKGYVFRGQNAGVAGKGFQACGVALPPVVRSCSSCCKFGAHAGKACH